jgi:hypothetical protein
MYSSLLIWHSPDILWVMNLNETFLSSCLFPGDNLRTQYEAMSYESVNEGNRDELKKMIDLEIHNFSERSGILDFKWKPKIEGADENY